MIRQYTGASFTHELEETYVHTRHKKCHSVSSVLKRTNGVNKYLLDTNSFRTRHHIDKDASKREYTVTCIDSNDHIYGIDEVEIYHNNEEFQPVAPVNSEPYKSSITIMSGTILASGASGSEGKHGLINNATSENEFYMTFYRDRVEYLVKLQQCQGKVGVVVQFLKDTKIKNMIVLDLEGLKKRSCEQTINFGAVYSGS